MLTDVNGAAYRVDIFHRPQNGSAVCWEARIYRAVDTGTPVYEFFASSREQAFDEAQEYIKRSQIEPERPSVVYFDPDGEPLVPTWEES